jgi:inner membrane protein
MGSQWHNLIILISVIANNFPDIDLVYSMSSKLSYIVHHRGYTHTLAFILPLVLTILLLTKLWTIRKNVKLLSKEWGFISGVALCGGLLHLLLDSSNSYGIHPFWPIENSWYYGDSIFIVEPWLWIGLTTFCYHDLRTKTGKFLAVGIYFLSIALSLKTKLVPMPIVLALCTTGGAAQVIGHFSKGKWRFLPGSTLLAAIYITFFTAKQSAIRLFKENFDLTFNSSQLLDVSLTPFPANPFCWTAVAASIKDNKYMVAKAKVGPVMEGLDIIDCSSLPFDSGLANLIPMKSASNREVDWLGYLEMDLTEVSELNRTCEFHSLLKFSRIPFWNREWLGDLRYDHSQAGSFCSIKRTTNAPTQCPSYLPSWIPPRSDLLNFAATALNAK